MESANKNSAKQSAVDTAKAVLDGQLGVIEGCVRLHSLSDDLVPAWIDDKDFIIFGGIASEADDLPFGEVRARWSPSALATADAQIADYGRRCRDVVLEACRHVVDRFSDF